MKRVFSREFFIDGFYKKNLSVLEERKEGKKLIEKIESLPFPQNAEVVKTRKGPFTLKVRKEDGGEILFHSAYDPFKEAKNFITGYNLEDTLFLIVIGFGLGYHVEEILRTCPWIKLVLIIEPCPSFFKLALGVLDLSFILSSPKVKLVLEEDPLKIKKEVLPLAEVFLTGKSSIVLYNPYFYLLKDKMSQIKKSVQDAIFWSVTNLTTNIAKGGVFQKNILLNIPEVIKNPGVKNLFGRFKNKPAICVAAGPSLDKNVHVLHQAKNRALIICVDAALKTLLEKGVKPDIVVSIDYGIGARNLFNGVMDKTDDLFLAADPEVYPRVLSDFKGKKFIINIRKPLTRWLERFVGDKGLLNKGASVAHTAFSLAEASGANPIVLVGQDLCYPGGVTHAGGAVPRKKIAVGVDKKTGKKYLLIRTEEGNWVARDLVMVEDIYGRPVPTSPDMYSYLIYFERLIGSTKTKVIDATEGGARIGGTEIMPLEKVVEKYCQEEFEVRKILEEAARVKEEVDLDGLREEMKRVILKLREINFYAEQGQKAVARLQEGFKRKISNYRELKSLASESNRLQEKIRKFEEYIRSFLEDEMYSHLYLAQRRTNLRLDKFSKRKKLINQMEKVGIFYEGVKKATTKLIKDFEFSLASIS